MNQEKDREEFENFMLNIKGLPPLVGAISNGSVTWQRLENIDYEVLGYFLSCHLIIEHYMDEFLKIGYPSLVWEDSKLTFSQKAQLLTNFTSLERYKRIIPSIKHMNRLRNKISHRIDFKITDEDLLPLKYYLQDCYGDSLEIPTDISALLNRYTSMVCVFFASSISAYAR